MLKRRLTRFEQIGITGLVLVLTCLIYVKNFYEPTHRKYMKIFEKHEKLRSQFKKLERKHSGSENIKASIESTQKKLFETQTGVNHNTVPLATRTDVIEMLAEISLLAGTQNLKIKKFLPVEQQKISGQEINSVRERTQHCLVMTGNFIDLKKFVSGLDGLPKLVIVENMMIERINNRGNLKISLKLSI